MICKNCETTISKTALFCPECGNSIDEKIRDKQVNILTIYFRNISTGLLLLSLLLFFIACFTPLFTKPIEPNNLISLVSNKFYHYFYRVFKDFFSIPKSERTYSLLILLSISSILILSNLIINITTFTLGLIRGLKSFKQNTNPRLTKLVCMSFTSTLILVIWFSGFVAIHNIMIPHQYLTKVGIFYLIALIMSGIFLITTTVFNIILNSKSFLTNKNITFLILKTLTIIFTLIAITTISTGLFVFEINYIGNSVTTVKPSIIYTFILLDTAKAYSIDAIINKHLLEIFQLFVFVGTIIVGSLLVGNTFFSITNNDYTQTEKSNCDNLILPIILMVKIIVILLLSIILLDVLSYANLKNIKIGSGIIISLIFSIIVLGLTIANIISNLILKKERITKTPL